MQYFENLAYRGAKQNWKIMSLRFFYNWKNYC